MWQYEGDFTLYDLMQRKDWPYNLEPLLFGQSLDGPRTAQRRAASLRVVMQQVRLPGRETRPGRNVLSLNARGLDVWRSVSCICNLWGG